MSREQALAEAEAFLRRSVERSGGKTSERDIKAAAERAVRTFKPEAEKV